MEHDELKEINRRWLFQGGIKIDDNKISPLLAQNLILCRRRDEEILIEAYGNRLGKDVEERFSRSINFS